MKGFFERNEATFAAAEANPGFYAAAENDEADPWHAVTRPAIFAAEEYAGRVADTLSVWKDLEAVYAFAYTGLHARALHRRKEWFVEGEWLVYVAWWVEDDQIPTWDEAYERHALLQREGATPAAFDFKEPFDAAGRPYRINREAIMGKYGRQAGRGLEDK
jgi:hypothetical protein